MVIELDVSMTRNKPTSPRNAVQRFTAVGIRKRVFGLQVFGFASGLCCVRWIKPAY
jgi:hypothetical protein